MSDSDIVEWTPTLDLRYHTQHKKWRPYHLQRKFMAKTRDGLCGEIWVDVNPENTFERIQT